MNPLTLEGKAREKERRKMIRDALEEKSPVLFRQLKKSNQLRPFLKSREKEMMAVYRQGWNRLVDHHSQEKNAKKNPLEHTKALEADLRNLWNEILATYLEFSREG
jgi:nicotinamide mononucleotide adenylyltransferase